MLITAIINRISVYVSYILPIIYYKHAESFLIFFIKHKNFFFNNDMM